MESNRPTSPAQAYQEYYGPAIFEPLTDELLALSAVAPGDRVLDVACGTGIVTRRAASIAGDDGRVTGVDINPAMLEVARSIPAAEGTHIEWREGDGTALPLPDRSFDLVLCQQGLQFFPDRAAGLREMRRVLVEGGRLGLAVWQGLGRHPLFQALAEAEVPHLSAFGIPATVEEATAPFSLGDSEELRSLVTDAGFREIEVVERTIAARFPADQFVERMEYAYAAVVPQFAADPEAFAAYLRAIDADTKSLVERYRVEDRIVVPMHTHVLTART